MAENLENKLVTLDNFKDLRKNVAFHFTSNSNVESILQNGLIPKIGDNASGDLGRETIDKTFISYGLEGVLQLYNRLLNLSYNMPIQSLQTLSHIPFIPKTDKSPSETLSQLEGFEFVRQYMENNSYFIIDTTITQYEHEITSEDIKSINHALSNLTLPNNNTPIQTQIKDLTKQIKELSKNADSNKDILLSLVNQRKALTIQLRQLTEQMLNEKRGKLLNASDNPNFEQIDFNDDADKLRWYDQIDNPSNAHVRVIEDDKGIHGVSISKDELHLFSKDGQTPSNGLDFLQAILPKVNVLDKISARSEDPVLAQFSKYITLVEQYKAQGLLQLLPKTTYAIGNKSITVPERYVMDLTDLSKYPNLQEYIDTITKTVQSLGKESVNTTTEKVDAAETAMNQDERAMAQTLEQVAPDLTQN